MTFGDEEGFLDLLYDAPFDPALWIPILEQLADLMGGASAMLSELNLVDGSGAVEIARIDPTAPGRYFDYYALRNPLSNVADPRAYLEGWRPRVLTDDDWMPKEDLLRSEYYNDFMAPQDIHSVAMIRLATRGLNVSAISVTRPKRRDRFAAGDLALAERLQPHLIRAFTLGRKLACQRGARHAMAEALERTEHGIFLLDRSGRVRHVNQSGEELIAKGEGLAMVGGRLRAVTAVDDRRLQALVRDATRKEGEQRTGGAVALATFSRRRPLSVTVTPVGAERFSIFHEEPAVMVCVTDLQAEVSLGDQRLRDLFGLSPAEARVALALFDGQSPKQAAASLGLSYFTVRGHLVRIFDKTQTGGQVELTRLMMRAAGAGESGLG
jgi:DNA-binding CsgD family transcriptional regulator/PAS domain-containing protein